MDHEYFPKLVTYNPDTLPYSESEANLLPKLPVPPLKDTLKKYLATLQPLLEEDEFLKVVKLVLQFSRGVGGYAQEYLYKQRNQKENWAVEYFINEYYLDWRTPLALMLNTATILPPKEFKTCWDLARYGAAMIDVCITQKELVDNQQIPVATSGGRTKGQKLCMGQWYNILTTCRVPDFKRDRLVTSIGRGSGQEHIIVINKKQFYCLVVKRLDTDGNLIRLTIPEIAQALVTILKQPRLPCPSVGVLSTWDRDNWAIAYQFLTEEPRNQLYVQKIQSSLLVLCLDDPIPAEDFNRPSAISNDHPEVTHQNRGFRAGQRDETNMFHHILHGGGSTLNGANRWYEKTLQVVISTDGVSGVLMEHTANDGVCLNDLIERMLENVKEQNLDEEAEKNVQVPEGTVNKMNWIVSEEMELYIAEAAGALDRLVADIDLYVYRYTEFGKEAIKGLNCSPDAFVQLAIQLAYFKLHQRMETTWESVSTRRFRLGRVEVARAGSAETLQWMEAMETNAPIAERLTLLEVALTKHSSQLEDCAFGRGFDTHLLGLREASKALTGSYHPMFLDESYKVAHKFTMGTSQVPTKTEMFSGYGHPVPDGYGCCYNIRESSIIFSISSWKADLNTSSAAFAEALKQAMLSMKDLLQNRTSPNRT